jgi:hypothetical protein
VEAGVARCERSGTSYKKLFHLRNSVADHLEAICLLFTERPKITIVIRTPWITDASGDGDVVLTDDDFDLAIAAINRLRDRQPV